jgi:hypothetical protein
VVVRDMLGDTLVWAGGVVVSRVLGEHGAQVCLAEDQQVVENLAAQCADQVLADRVGLSIGGLCRTSGGNGV